VIVAHVNETPPPPHLLRPDLPPAVERVVLAALAKRPEERPQTAGELARRLSAATRGELATSEPTRPVRAPAARATDQVASLPTNPTRRASGGNAIPPTVSASGYASTPETRRGLSPVAAGVVAVAMLAIGAAIAAATFGVLNWRDAGNANRPTPAPAPSANTNAAPAPAPPANTNVAPVPVPVPPTNTNAAPAPPDATEGRRPLDETEEREVDAFLSDWLASARAKNVNWHVRHYADVVDYYQSGQVPRFRVRADRARAFERFDTIDLRIPAVREATVTPDGREFRLVVDKQWRFSGADGDSTGKVKQLIVLRRVGTELKIVAEKDLAVY